MVAQLGDQGDDSHEYEIVHANIATMHDGPVVDRPPKVWRLWTSKLNLFDSTKGYPGEGPEYVKCERFKCQISPHFHRLKKPRKAAHRRISEKKNQREAKESKWVECKYKIVQRTCGPHRHMFEDEVEAGQAEAIQAVIDTKRTTKPTFDRSMFEDIMVKDAKAETKRVNPPRKEPPVDRLKTEKKEVPELKVPQETNVKDYTTKRVKIYLLNNRKRQYLERLYRNLGRALAFVGLGEEISSSTTDCQLQASQTVRSWWGGWYGRYRRERNLDPLAVMGYTAYYEGEVIVELVEGLVRCMGENERRFNLPRAIDRAGKPTQDHIDSIEVAVRTHFPSIHRHAPQYLILNSCLRATNLRCENCYISQKLVISNNVCFGAPAAPVGVVMNPGLYKMRKTGYLDKPPQFIPNGRFRLSKEGWKPDGTLDEQMFEPKPKIRRGYATVCGPTVVSSVQYPAESAMHIKYMVYRIMSKRKPERIGEHDELARNQNENFPLLLENINEWFSETVLSVYETMLTRPDLMRNAVVYARPEVQRLYETVYNHLLETGRTAFPGGGTQYNEIKLKCEKLKSRKVARMFVNLGVPSTLEGSYILKAMKERTAQNPIIVNGAHLRFIPRPTQKVMFEWVERIENNENFVFVHSDDAFYQVRTGGGRVRRFNIDISKCDSSHGPAVWATFATLFRAAPDLYVELLDQLMRPLRFVSKNFNIQATMKPLTPFLGSGHVFTTMVNTFVLMIILAKGQEQGICTRDGLIMLGKRYGYFLTVEECTIVQHCTFLKYSPVVNNQGSWAPLKQLGVLLRSLGVCEGDLPGSGDWKVRARAHTYGTLCSYGAGVSFPFLDRMIHNYKPTPEEESNSASKDARERVIAKVKTANLYKTYQEPTRLHSFSDEAVLKRYEHLADMKELISSLDTIAELKPGQAYQSKGTHAILAFDYDLDPAPELPPDPIGLSTETLDDRLFAKMK